MSKRVFYDTEFIERGPQWPITRISLGAVDEDDNSFYVINSDLDLQRLANHDWHLVNTVPALPVKWNKEATCLVWDKDHPDYCRVMDTTKARKAIVEFMGEKPEIWAYYGAYDHVILAQWFGTMLDLPPSMPMFTNEIMTYATLLQVFEDDFPECCSGDCGGMAHYAPHDAGYLKKLHEFLEVEAFARWLRSGSKGTPA